MNKHRSIICGIVWGLHLLACSPRERQAPVAVELLPGSYCASNDVSDSIFVYSNNTYKHTYHRSDGGVLTQTNTWRYRADLNAIFFESFFFFHDLRRATPENYRGAWSPKVIVGDNGTIKLRYSERIHYEKAVDK